MSSILGTIPIAVIGPVAGEAVEAAGLEAAIITRTRHDPGFDRGDSFLLQQPRGGALKALRHFRVRGRASQGQLLSEGRGDLSRANQVIVFR